MSDKIENSPSAGQMKKRVSIKNESNLEIVIPGNTGDESKKIVKTTESRHFHDLLIMESTGLEPATPCV